jgi:DNA-binding MarR family transcriptional regulator
MADLRVQLGELWRLVSREMHDRMKQAFKGVDFPPMAFFLLRHIAKDPGLTIGELSRRSGTVKSHVSKMVEQLVAQGLVEKRPDPSDQRLVRLVPTKTATDSKAEMEAKVQTAWLAVIQEIPDEEMDEVVRGMRIMLAALQRSNRHQQNGDEPQ